AGWRLTHADGAMESHCAGMKDRLTFNHGVEEEDVGILEVLKYEGYIKHFVKGATDGNEVGDEYVRVVKLVAKDMCVDLSELSVNFWSWSNRRISAQPLSSPPSTRRILRSTSRPLAS
ncbi:hypothetical protein HAX54_050612, partial [Datura stramonium]|nr:hypothetical protein [Datura stramonium]